MIYVWVDFGWHHFEHCLKILIMGKYTWARLAPYEAPFRNMYIG